MARREDVADLTAVLATFDSNFGDRTICSLSCMRDESVHQETGAREKHYDVWAPMTGHIPRASFLLV